jgi:hypothetical protein
LGQEPGKSHFIFSAKQQVNDYLKEKADEGKITYSTLATGAFFDWSVYCYSSFLLRLRLVAIKYQARRGMMDENEHN